MKKSILFHNSATCFKSSRMLFARLIPALESEGGTVAFRNLGNRAAVCMSGGWGCWWRVAFAS